MTKSTTSSPAVRIEDDPVWRAVSKICRYAYNVAQQVSEDNFTLRNKLEYAVYDVTSDAAEAAGSLDPRDIKWSLGRVRKGLFSLKNSYSLALHTNQLSVESETMLAIDEAVKMVDERVAALQPEFKKWRDEMTIGEKS